jgi:hypothetical protein
MKWVIVGAGPSCVYALERLVAWVTHCDLYDLPLSICIFERSGLFGAGEVNSDVQPPTSLMNRIAAQVSFAADASNWDAGPLLPISARPTLHEWWLRRTGSVPDQKVAPQPGDIPSRRLHGIALKEAFNQHLVFLRAAGLAVDLHAEEVVDVVATTGTSELSVHSSQGLRVAADRVLFLTGNAWCFEQHISLQKTNPDESFRIAPPYPLDRQLTEVRVPAGRVVGIDGLGLTAIDVILHLTEGRGGRFVASPSGSTDETSSLVYVPSGNEPSEIIGFSPSGLLPCCRPNNEKLNDTDLHYKGKFFTAETVNQLRISRGIPVYRSGGCKLRQLDFEADVLPVLVLELARLYHLTYYGNRLESLIDKVVGNRFTAFVSDSLPLSQEIDRHGAVDFLLDPLLQMVQRLKWSPVDASLPPDMQFDWRSLFWPASSLGSRITQSSAQITGLSWTQWIINFIELDLAAGSLGNLRNPIKAACDGVFRDLRHVFCEVVDNGGLTPGSDRFFRQCFLRIYMRLSNGAGIEPTTKILALVKHGILNLSIGPEPEIQCKANGYLIRGRSTRIERFVPLIIKARLGRFDARVPKRTLYSNMLRSGLIRLWKNSDDFGNHYYPGGIELDAGFHPVGRDGVIDRRLTFMGPAAEGQRLFQSAAARPLSNYPVFNALSTWVSEGLKDAAMASSKVTGSTTKL